MKSTSVLLIVCYFFLHNGAAELTKTLHGCSDPSQGLERTVIIDRDELFHSPPVVKRSTDSNTIVSKINHLNDTHEQLIVHWVGNGSNAIICLARNPNPTQDSEPSAVYISYDNGDTYEDKTSLFKVSNESDQIYATLEKFYIHPTYDTHLVFTDIKNNLLFVTTNHGQDIKKITLDFSPIQVSFHELEPSVFIVLDQLHRLWVTEDFGNTFRQMQDSVRSFHWVKENDSLHSLVVQRMETDGYNTILYSNDLFLNGSGIVRATNISDFCVRDDYLFTTKVSPTGVLELYLSHKLGKEKRGLFHTKVDIRSYFIVDVTSNRALVVVSDSNTVSHLHVSDYLDNEDDVVMFMFSLVDVLSYLPNSTLNYTWIHRVPENAFVDVYKVEGLSGIYIASQVVPNTELYNNNVSLWNLRSYITFDHGHTWRLIQAPERDVDGHPIPCSVNTNCSLHLNLEFNQRHSGNRSTNILSSKSIPGIIIATGVVGKSLDGHRGVYVSNDAGLTWRQVLNDSYLFNMGDHGGILTAIEFSKLNGETRYILYSTDEGEKWQQAKFHSENIRLYGLTTEPGENTTMFIVFGSLPEDQQWTIFKLELRNAFKYNCSKDDYTTWPSSNQNNISCVLGQQLTYQRRKRHANCYGGENFDTSISIVPCSCDFRDYLCDFGFVRSDEGHCVRNASIVDNPYNVPITCKLGEFYNRSRGYRKIPGDVCIDGVENRYLPEEVPCPTRDLQGFLLVSEKNNISKYDLITKKLEPLPLKKLENVVTFDFDMKSNCVYWADIAFKTIERQCMDNGQSEILVNTDLDLIEGMALDWMSNNLYFVDGKRSKIELIRTDISHSGRMRRTVVGPTHLKKPRGIALHPKAGYMFWTDWSVENPSVNRADLDGTNIKKLFGEAHVRWPNGITVDYAADKIYWVDAGKDYIATSNINGDHFKHLIFEGNDVGHPFGIAVFKNKMYWTEWRNNAIFSADKDGQGGHEILARLRLELDLKVYADGIRTGTNSCTNTSCSHICVGKPDQGKACLCPDGMELKNETCVPDTTKPFVDLVNPPIQNSCRGDLFRCTDGHCIPNRWKCDGEKDCADGSDESHCVGKTCSSNYFTCANGFCIPMRWRCDRENDCLDRSDEINCSKKCTETQFSCDNGTCLPAIWKCDGSYDCVDKSDEQDCVPCKNDEFDCKLGSVRCIPQAKKCNGKKDCLTGLDEVGCENMPCSEKEFPCYGRGHYIGCINYVQVCDGIKNCIDGRDEENCTTTASSPPKNKICPYRGMFECANQNCVTSRSKCNGIDDCGDGSDEVGCHNITTTTNTTKTSTTAISMNPETTSNKRQNCTEQEFACRNGLCIRATFKCDGDDDCLDKSDELNCATCLYGEYACGGLQNKCIPHSWVCDDDIDCPDGRDEMNCKTTTPKPPKNKTCEHAWMFQCANQQCIPSWWKCDDADDCGDGSDEVMCHNTTTTTTTTMKPTTVIDPDTPSCKNTEFRCKSSPNSCIPQMWHCDGEMDCNDGSDELNCTDTNACPEGQYACGGSHCIPFRWLCDGQPDCADGKDEKNCRTTTPERGNVTVPIIQSLMPVQTTSPSSTQIYEPVNVTSLE
ncbi:sortilin-related receptor-like isoform X2 [Zophobas morio]|uniref:sortilin-related receptor-like isoform X2 n=1 Tax=Zophobas morio TaxID=2755281 RepID=UPI0030836FA4